MTADTEERQAEWSRDTRKLAVLSWMSFLAAAVFMLPLFAVLDPLILVDAINTPLIESRNAGYALGFFFLWANGWIAGWLTLRLVRRKRTGPGAVSRSDSP